MDCDDIVKFIVENYGWIAMIMTALITGLIQLIKIPIKKLTSKIASEKMRKLANKSIIVLSFALAFLVEYLGHLCLPKYIPFSSATALVEGAFSNILYLLGEGIITKPQAKQLADEVKDATSDASSEEAEKTAVKAFHDMIDSDKK